MKLVKNNIGASHHQNTFICLAQGDNYSRNLCQYPISLFFMCVGPCVIVITEE